MTADDALANSDTILIDLDFTSGFYDVSSASWSSKDYPNSLVLDGRPGKGWYWEHDITPLDPVLDTSLTEDSINSQYSYWGGTACSAPVTNQYYLGGSGARFIQDVTVKSTDRLTVEFWFRSDAANSLAAQAQTVLLSLFSESTGKEVMTVFVDGGVLKCAPFGRTSSSSSILTYAGVNPLTDDKWYHISCGYIEQRFITGQYVAYNLGDINSETMLKKARQPKKFTIPITNTVDRNPTFVQSITYRAVIGNDVGGNMDMYGSFKEVKIWAELRSDTDLYAYRDRQIPVEENENLMGYFKLMNGREMIINDAIVNDAAITFPTVGTMSKIIPSDGDNRVCAQEMFFNPETKKCTRFPFSSEIPIIYIVQNNVQHGHQMLLMRFTQSTMTLAGNKYQPRLSPYWTVDN